MWLYSPIRTPQAPVRIGLVALVSLALACPRTQGGFIAPLAFDAGSNANFVVVADFNGDGIPDLAVTGLGSDPNYRDGIVSILLGKGDGTFQAARHFFAGPLARGAAVGDFNGDGHLDLVVVNHDSLTDTVSVLLGNGDGTFQTSHVFLSGYANLPSSVAVGDFNGDGILDLAVVGGQGPTVSILFGNGDGTFQDPHRVPTGTYPGYVVAADLNGDGRLDLAMLAYDDAAGAIVSVLLGNGDGTFQPVRNSPCSGGSVLAVGDLNGDGIPDVAFASGQTGPDHKGSVSIMLGNGDGTFQAPHSYRTGTASVSLAIGDFNGDGTPDLAVANTGSGYLPGTGSVSVLLGNGDGTFQAAQNYALGYLLACVAVGDFDGNGIPDLAVIDSPGFDTSDQGTVSILLGKGDGTFEHAPGFPAGSSPSVVAVADLNGDSIPDLVVAGYDPGSRSVHVLLGKGNATFQVAGTFSAGSSPSSLAIGDFNGDGIPDLAIADYYSESVSVLLGNGDGTFQASKSFSTGGNRSNFVAIGDLNGDGILDLVVANGGSETVTVLLGNGDGTFQAPGSFAAGPHFGSNPTALAVADFNGDGFLDLAVANGPTGNVCVLLGNGDGTFQAARTFPAGGQTPSVAIGDFNGDGIVDLAVANGPSGTVSVLLGNGDGTFQDPRSFPGGSTPTFVTAADCNSDGRLDLIVVSSQTVRVLLGNGDGTFQPTYTSYVAGSSAISLAIADFNADGWPDLAVANNASGDVSILLNDHRWP
ncbi:MAG TPA: VCBS repeat-containing protein [Gemmataceae bacterium]|nr:VCBS repeat-containing protein [Gemmataceae bacterium]